MSNAIDRPIVEMGFDNKQFEKGATESIKTLEQLKKSLVLDKASDGLSKIMAVAKTFSVAHISEGVDNLRSKFSALNVVGFTALQNITNKALSTGASISKALTITPVTTGFTEYETKMGAIQTILTNTASKGVQLQDVNDVLNELNEYSDQTIYNFSEMAKNIGTFTAAGVGLKTSATAIKGIANLAAGSGSTSLQASTAMYQLSQALAAGSVKLMDWNSIVNAGMGGELFQNALKKTAKGLGIIVDESVPFRESLNDGWITAKVLTETLADFAEDEALVKAATQVKSFTQLFGTMKESVQSGWAMSWENIIGDKDQSSKVLTDINNAFGEMVGSSAKARNEMLKYWNQEGGRYALINTLSNSFKVLKAAIAPIQEAFDLVFPAMTKERIVDIFNAISHLSNSFKISDKTVSDIKETFTGLFSILDIVKKTIMAVTKGVLDFIVPLVSGQFDILGFTASIGLMITQFRDSLIAGKAFEKMSQNITEGLRVAKDYIVEQITAFSEYISTIKIFNDLKIKNPFDVFKDFKNPFAKDLIPDISTSKLSAFDGFFKVVGGILSGLGKIKDAIAQTLSGLTFDDIVKLIVGGTLLTSLVKFVKGVVGVMRSTSDMFAETTEVLGSVRESLEAYQKKLKAESLMRIAVAIGLLAASILVLSFIDPTKLTTALIAITGLFVNLIAAMAVLDKITKDDNGGKLAKLSFGLIGMSTAILILADALLKVSTLNVNQLAQGLLGISLMLVMLVATAKSLDTTEGKLLKTSLGLNAFATAMMILIKVVKEVGALDIKVMMQGLLGMGLMVASLTVMLKMGNFGGLNMSTGLAIMGIAVAVNILAMSLGEFNKLKLEEIKKVVMGIGSILGIIALFTRAVDTNKIISTSVALGIIAGALYLLGISIKKIGEIPVDGLKTGIAAIAVSLTVIMLALNSFPKDMLSKSIGLVAVAGALLLIALAMTELGKLTATQLITSLLGMAGALAIIAGAMYLMTTALPGAAALLIVSAALLVLLPVLLALSKMPKDEILNFMLALGGAFLILAAGAFVLGTLSPLILALGGAVLVLGVGMLAGGAGLLLFSAGLTALVAIGSVAFVALKPLITNLASMIPMVLGKIGEGIFGIIKLIISKIPVLVNAVVDFVGGLIKGVTSLIPSVVDAATKLFSAFIDSIVPAINVYKIVDEGLRMVGEFLKGVIKGLPQIIDSAYKLVVSFIDGLSAAIDANGKQLYESVKKLIMSFVNLSIYILGDVNDDLTNVGKGFVKSIVDAMLGVAKSVAEPIGQMAIEAYIALDIMRLDFETAGINVIRGFTDGITSAANAPVQAISDMANNVINTAKKVFDINSPSWVMRAQVGVMIPRGVAEGVTSATDVAEKAAKDMVAKIIATSKNALAIPATSQRAPSRIFDEELGRKVPAGVAKGIDTEADLPVKSAKSMSEKVVDAAREAFNFSKEWIDDRKYYNELSLKEELAAWERVQARYKKGTDERKDADKEVYRVKQAIAKDIEDTEKRNEDKRKADLKASYDLSKEWIDERKYYNELSLGQELAAWERVQARYLKGTDERKAADREVYRVKKEITEKIKSIDDDYTEKSKTVREQLKADIKSVNDDYESALNERTKTLQNAYGLFDNIEQVDPVDGKQLIANLGKQVMAMTVWEANINELAKKGIQDGLLAELRDMGPSASAEIEALNKLSAPELDSYVALWKNKAELARTQASLELDYMQRNSMATIVKMNADADVELDKLKTIWTEQMTAINITSATNLTAVSSTFESNMTEITDKTTEQMNLLNRNLQAIDWSPVGVNIILGIKKGLTFSTGILNNAAIAVAKSALASAKAALGIQSPSKEFEKVGMYSMLGMRDGLVSNATMVDDASYNVGRSALDNIKNAVSQIPVLLESTSDFNPTIRPVLDLSDIKSGSKKLSGMLDNNVSSIAMSGNLSRLQTVANGSSSSGNPTQSINNNNNSNVQFVQNNYSPTALSRVDIYRQTQNQVNMLKGVVKNI